MLQNAGPEGQAVLGDIDTFISGINAYRSSSRFLGRALDAQRRLCRQRPEGPVRRPGRRRRGASLAVPGRAPRQYGQAKGKSIFNDLRQFKNPESPTSVDGNFNYGQIPAAPDPAGSFILDPGSFQPTPAAQTQDLPEEATATQAAHASNTLMIGASASATGRPLMVGGPQIGYFYPGFTYEIDMHAPGLQWRGATSAPFPGYMLIGRGEDFATTLTSSSGDIIDQYAEFLCGGSDRKYLYKGECRNMQLFNAGTLNGDPVRFWRTVHGPVVGYATVAGNKRAISSKRSSYGRDVLDQLFYRRLSTGAVSDPASFFEAAAKTPQTFNSFYIDNEHIAEYTSGRLPLRPADVDPGMVTQGTGQYEWEGSSPTTSTSKALTLPTAR